MLTEKISEALIGDLPTSKAHTNSVHRLNHGIFSEPSATKVPLSASNNNFVRRKI